MAVTNSSIILLEQIKLAEEGKLTIDTAGNIEPIHTYAKWKQLGYVVKRGERAITKFPVWKYSAKKKTEEQKEESGYCFMKTASFFSLRQVEKLKDVN